MAHDLAQLGQHGIKLVALELIGRHERAADGARPLAVRVPAVRVLAERVIRPHLCEGFVHMAEALLEILGRDAHEPRL